MHREEDGTETFGFPTSFKGLIWTSVGCGLILIVGMICAAVSDPSLRTASVSAAAFVGIATLYLLRLIAVRLPEKIHADDRAIIYEAADGALTTLPWDQVARVVDRPVAQCLDVHGSDGFTIIRIENQIDRFDRLREIVLERSASEDLDELPVLPATFSRTWVYLIAIIACTLLIAGFGVAAILFGNYLGIVFILFGLVTWLDWLTIRIDRSAITFRHLLWKRTIRFDRIEDVRIETSHPGHGNALSTVAVRLSNGKTRRIVAVHGGSLGLYRTLRLAWQEAT